MIITVRRRGWRLCWLEPWTGFSARTVPDAVVYNSEDVGLMLWKQMRPDDDFQHLPSWRELVVATALSLRRHHADTLIVPMSLIRDAYRAEILGDLDCTQVMTELNSGDAQPIAQDVTGQPLCHFVPHRAGLLQRAQPGRG